MEQENGCLGVGNANGSPTSSYPPSYYSGWQSESEMGGKEPEQDARPITFLRTRAATFGSLAGKEVNEKFGQAKRWITRSGTLRPEDFTNENAYLERTYLRRRFSGWRGGVLLAVVSAGSVLMINLCFTIWAAATSRSGMNIGTIYEDDCSKIKSAGIGIHIAINIMGTLLLGSSNYTMQCLSSPTRKEVDTAHSKGEFVDIGIPSLRNLTSWKKKSLFGALVISTIPLHFLWNSAVFITKQQLDYQVYVVTPEFFKHPAVDCSQNVSVGMGDSYSSVPENSLQNLHYKSVPLYYKNYPDSTPNNSTTRNLATNEYSGSDAYWYQRDTCQVANELLRNATVGKLQRLSNEECIKAYGPGNARMKGRSNLLAVTKAQPLNTNTTILMDFRYETFVSNYTGNNWVCNPALLNANAYKCDWKTLAKTADWNLGWVEQEPENIYKLKPGIEYPIDYCLSQTTDLGGACQLQYSLIIMLCVILANLTKFGVIFYFLWSSHAPVLATIGDGIASFLEQPDTMTPRPFLDRRGARKFKKVSPASIRWTRPKTKRWWSAPTLLRWIITVVLCSIAIIVSILLLKAGVAAVAGYYENPFSIGFGDYNSIATLNLAVVSNPSSSDFASNAILIEMVAIANIPQVIVSCLYFAYNTVYTSMVSADEWSRFTVHRKTLRTTDPAGLQRSTYWLSLPWTYGLPLAAASSLLHWLISQSLFVARTAILDTYGETESISYMAIGYSPLAILLSVTFGIAMVLTMIINGSRKLHGGILVGNNSLAIAAACQRPKSDANAHLKTVKWGALVGGDEDGKPHCCFTSLEVEDPKIGEVYR